MELLFPAFLAGLLTFFAPCTLPLVPVYLGMISGLSQEELKEGEGAVRARVIRNGVLFVAGFTLVFLLLGLAAGSLGALIGPYRDSLLRIGGLLVVVASLPFLTKLPLPFLQRTFRPDIELPFAPGNPWHAALLGALFAAGWTPCIGPVLATVLFLASSGGRAGEGAVLLLAFAVGHGLPFLAVAAGYGRLLPWMVRLRRHGAWLEAALGVFLLGIGLAMLFGAWGSIAGKLFGWFDFLNYESILRFL